MTQHFLKEPYMGSLRGSPAIPGVKRSGSMSSIGTSNLPEGGHCQGGFEFGAALVARGCLAPLPQVEGPVDERVEDGRGAAEEEDDVVQVLSQLLVEVEEDRDDHADVVGGPADDEGADDDDGDPQGLDLCFSQHFASGVVEGTEGPAEDARSSWKVNEYIVINCKL
ncbi:hypothetical protein CDAR_246181 [Caerostris darwini]|uniref:Uncharacterized protein n=1 Tax=Caerostris darwini TaxID=1538125 RepID=A0AAV4W9S2_9ARAC|nr:hypothetical protein CDAR_246181 [Caerostris darwini]